MIGILLFLEFRIQDSEFRILELLTSDF